MTTQNNSETARKSTTVRLSLGKQLTAKAYMPIVLLWAVTLFLTAFGLLMVLSSSSVTSFAADRGMFGVFSRQAIYTALGIPTMIVVSRLPISFWKKYAWHFFALGLFLQLLVHTGLGVEEGGNRNWLQLGQLRAQPSEFLKLALVVWMATILWKKEKLIKKTAHALIPAILPGALIALALVLLGRDLGTGLVMFAMVVAVLFFAEVDWKALWIVILSVVAVALILLITSPNRMRRLLGFVGDADDYSGHDWQPLHGIWALAGGGIFGSGLGGSKAKWSWLPAAENDYIFAIIGEEFGLLGALGVILIYVVLAFAMVRSMMMVRDRFGRAAIGGIMVWVIGQAFINIAVVLRLLPVIGVPLPFISAGGTALIANLLAMGVVISIARDGYDFNSSRPKKSRSSGTNL